MWCPPAQGSFFHARNYGQTTTKGQAYYLAICYNLNQSWTVRKRGLERLPGSKSPCETVIYENRIDAVPSGREKLLDGNLKLRPAMRNCIPAMREVRITWSWRTLSAGVRCGQRRLAARYVLHEAAALLRSDFRQPLIAANDK